jgi:quercetin dioxygenase-like cupin family protein
MTDDLGPENGISRRTVLKTSSASIAAVGMVTPATAKSMTKPIDAFPADGTGSRATGTTGGAVDEPVGFGVEVLAGHAAFTDTVAATFRTRYDDDDEAIVSTLPRDASNVLVAKVTWEPEGTSGWHTHPGPAMVSVVKGELEIINERDCVVRTYGVGEAFIDLGQGNVHIASNPSTTDITVAYATFLGVPDGQPATVSVEPVACTPATESWRPGRRGVL